MRSGLYLSIGGRLEAGVQIIATPYRVSWDVEIVEIPRTENEDADEALVK